jgi:release factor glutamine methyltransferase
MSPKDLLRYAEERLSKLAAQVGKGSLAHEAKYLVQAAYRTATRKEITGEPLSSLSSCSAEESQSTELELDRLLERRAQGEPLQHILGQWSFYENEYEVSPAVLIPRPETETLVHEVLKLLPFGKKLLGAEIGLGSGVISVELLHARPDLMMTATEASPDAVRIAQRNAAAILNSQGNRESHRLSVHLVDAAKAPCAELQKALSSNLVDFLVSNPPYLDGRPDSSEVEDEVRQSEPHLALFAPEHDLNFFYRDIAASAHQLVQPDGFVAVEIPHERAPSIEALFREAGYETRLELDLTGRPRVLIAKLRKKGNS